MNQKEILDINKFKSLAVEATKKINETYNAPDIIPYCSEILDIISVNMHLKKLFIHEIIDFFESRKVENEIIEFCCHALKWKELVNYFNQESCKAIEINDWDKIQLLGHIIDSFEENWENAIDFYSEYFYK